MKALEAQAHDEAREDEEAQNLPVRRTPEQRAEAALTLRLSGAPYAAIARTLEFVNAGAARSAVEQLLAESGGSERDIAAARAMTSSRLERLLRSTWPKATDPDDPDHLQYVRTSLAIIDRHARLLGADAPQKLEVYTPDQKAQEEWVQAMLREVGPDGVEEEENIIDAEIVEMDPDE